MTNSKFKLPGYLIKLTHETQVKDVYFGEDLYIKKVIYSKPATIVFWSDNTKTVSRCADCDTYSQETGLLICIFKKLYGRDLLAEILQYWAVPNKKTIDLSDVRAFKKFNGRQ